MQKLTLYVDGASRGNPGECSIGAVAFNEEGDEILQVSEYIGEGTNNFAEYEALIRALNGLLKIKSIQTGDSHLQIFSDSELMVLQIKGEYKVKHFQLREQHKTVSILLRAFAKFDIKHIKRELNEYADSLANKALDERL